jgi:hypothetical protein
MCLGRMQNDSSRSTTRRKVRTSTGCYIGTSMSEMLPIVLLLWQSRNEARTHVVGHCALVH